MRSLGVVTGVFVCALVGCGGGGGEPLVSGSVTGSFGAVPFTAESGIAGAFESDGEVLNLIAFGDGSIDCGSPSANEPPDGHSVAVGVPELAVGSYAELGVQLTTYEDGSIDSLITGGATVTITSVADTVAGEISFTYTDTETEEVFAVGGTFEVSLCD
jgi:hypothetical protein